MVRARAIASDNPNDTHQVYVVVERDGCQVLRVNSDDAGTLITNRRIDERVRRAMRAVTLGEYEL